MLQSFTQTLSDHIKFSYSSFDRVVLRGFLTNMFVEGSVILLLRNLGFKSHSNGVLKTLTDQLNSHIKKVASRLGITIHWWSSSEKEKYHSKLDFVSDVYRKELRSVSTKSKVLCIIKSLENSRTFANKEVTTKGGKRFLKMFSCFKFVSHYYIYIHDQELGLCYLKISSYLPFACEFYMNGHNYLKQQFDKKGMKYKMKDNSFVEVAGTKELESLVKDFKPSIALNRIDFWMDQFFRFDKGSKSTRSKLLRHKWYTYQTEISSNIIFKSTQFAKNFFQRVLQKFHTIGYPDRLTKIFGLSKPRHNSKTTQSTYAVQACIKHWLEKNSVKCYNKSGCLLRVETTINNPDLPGLKLKKSACSLQAYYWYGHGCNSRYLNTLQDIDISLISEEVFEKYQQTITTGKGQKVAAPDLRKEHQRALIEVLLCTNFHVSGFRNKDLRKKLGSQWKTAKIAYEMRKLRERGAIKKKQGSHYYQLTEEGYVWLFYSVFNYSHFVNPLMSKRCKKALKQHVHASSKIEEAYGQFDRAVSQMVSEIGFVA